VTGRKSDQTLMTSYGSTKRIKNQKRMASTTAKKKKIVMRKEITSRRIQ